MVPRPEPSGGSMVWAEQQVHGPACAASGRQAASRGRGAAVTQPFRRSQSRFLRLFSFFSSSFPLHSHFSYSLYNFSKIYQHLVFAQRQTQPQSLSPEEEQDKGFPSKGFGELEKGGAHLSWGV